MASTTSENEWARPASRRKSRRADVVDATAEVAADFGRSASETFDRVSDAVSEAYFRGIEYTRANPRNAALIALGVGIGIGCLLGRRRSGRGGSGLLSSLAVAAAGAAIDSFREADE